MSNIDPVKENAELKAKLAKLLKERESSKPFLCANSKCKERKHPRFCECGRIIIED